MAEFAVRVVEITQPVEHHPNADRLSLIRIHDYLCISAKLEDGSHRYKVGDLVVYVPEGAVVPDYLLRPGFWDETKNKGILAGPDGNRVKALNLRGIFSQGILFPVPTDYPDGLPYGRGVLTNGAGEERFVNAGDDVAEFLGIVKYEPPIPAAMSGEVANLFGHTMAYDVENLQGMPDIFADGEEIVATEKLHGTCCAIGFVRGLEHPEMFGDGDILVASKRLSATGLAFKDNEANDGNIYVQTLRKLLNDGFAAKIAALCGDHDSVHVFGEVFGPGVQDLGYGLKRRAFRVFDIAVDRTFLGVDSFRQAAADLGLDTVPTLYEGPFDKAALVAVRDGKDSLSGTHLREGIVIKSRVESQHPFHGRKSVKWVSPDYLLRKGNATEYA